MVTPTGVLGFAIRVNLIKDFFSFDFEVRIRGAASACELRNRANRLPAVG
jgi:hypothetical protein